MVARNLARACVGELAGIDLQHLRFAVAAEDCGSLRQAAETLGVRQWTLSRSIRQFEDKIGIVIFGRSSGGVEPTPAGRSILRMARTILEEFDALIATARSTRNGDAGRLASDWFLYITYGGQSESVFARFPAEVSAYRTCHS